MTKKEAQGNPERALKIELQDGGLHIDGYPSAVHLGALTSEAAKRLGDYELHRSDLEQCHSALQLLGNMLQSTDGLGDTWDRDAVEATLWAGICVSYCRCFGGGLRTSLDPAKIFGTNTLAREVHDHVWAMRNKHFAHDVNDIRRPFVGVALDVNGNNLDIISGRALGVEGFDSFSNLLNLIGAALAFVNEQRQAFRAVLVAEMADMAAGDRLGLPKLEYQKPKVENVNKNR